MSEFLVVTGMSGAGRSTAADSLEDLGWFVIDNLPPALIEKMADMINQPGAEIERVALVIGRGSGSTGSDYFDDLPGVLEALRATGNRVRVLFLDASDEVLSGATRAPAAATRWPPGGWRSRSPKSGASWPPCATGHLHRHRRAQLEPAAYAGARGFGDKGGASSMRTSVVSFGYKYGLPLDVDMVFDCRFLPNPFWVEELRPFSGLDDPCATTSWRNPRRRSSSTRWTGC